MAALVELGKYGAINTTDTEINGFYVIIFTSEANKFQDTTTIYGQIITTGKLVVEAQYICSMKVDTNWYCNQHPQQHAIIVPKFTIIHPQLEFIAVAYFHDIPKIICNREKAKKSISRHPICLTDSDYD